MSGQTRFARAFEPWIAEWAKAGISGTQERVMLLLAANMERDDAGRFVSWRPRSEMASILGVSEYTVRNAVLALTKIGMLEKVGKAYNGRAQKYVLMPRWKGYRGSRPFKQKGYQGEVRKGTTRPVLKGTSTATPTRTLDSGSASQGRPTAGDRDGGEPAYMRRRDGSVNPVL